MGLETVKTWIYHIEKRQERLLLRVPFAVEEDIERLTIAYDFARYSESECEKGRLVRSEDNIVDLALEDPAHEEVGASGSAHGEIVVHENYASAGYRPVRIKPGIWYVVLGAYKIMEGGCDVKLTVTQQMKETVLLTGDTHAHTVHSDGWYTVEELIARARQDRLDYLFITDHNSMSAYPHIRSYPDLTVLPGMELTYYDGHCNLYGVERPVRTYVANGRAEILERMREAKQSGALIGINHPVEEACGWRLGFDSDVPCDLVEIWNGPYTQRNADNMTMWHAQLCAGRRWPAVGGSDCHHDVLLRKLGTPATFLYSRSRSGSDILEAMRQGHAFIGMSPDAPRVELQMGEARMGDVCTKPNAPLRLSFERLEAGDEIRIVDQTGVAWSGVPGGAYRYEMEYKTCGSLFVRAEVWRTLSANRVPVTVTNPIYLM